MILSLFFPIFVDILPIFVELLAALEDSSRVFVEAISFLLPIVLSAIALKVGLVLADTARESPYSVSSVGVNGRPLPVEAVDLGDHDDAECLTCGRDDGPGVRRGFVEEIVLAGVPLWESDRSETYDCPEHTDREGLRVLGDEEDQDGLDLALDVASETSEDGDGA